jgi:hypothetical protein
MNMYFQDMLWLVLLLVERGNDNLIMKRSICNVIMKKYECNLKYYCWLISSILCNDNNILAGGSNICNLPHLAAYCLPHPSPPFSPTDGTCWTLAAAIFCHLRLPIDASDPMMRFPVLRAHFSLSSEHRSTVLTKDGKLGRMAPPSSSSPMAITLTECTRTVVQYKTNGLD